MMLPCVLPMLWRYRQTIQSSAGEGPGAAGPAALEPGGTCTRLASLTAYVALGYFVVYLLLGVLVLVLGLTLVDVLRLQPVLASRVPILSGLVILMAGVNQLTGAKLRRLKHCCASFPTVSGSQQHARCAWRHGFHIGVLCVRCCGGLMLILLVVGMMELRWMALITGAITLERLGRSGEHVARASGAVAITLGVMLISRAVREI
ncbi:MAG: DUF2182 domain-containing protein, partial [Sinobacteraceae bacterium]|nr:DUF2182 domain-containing protein [Nevskiaceae bacterium]